MIIERITGLNVPRIRFPICLARGTAYVEELVSGRLLGKTLRIPIAAVKTARKFRYFDYSKAVGELGLAQISIDGVFERVVAWLREQGYITKV